MLLTSTDLAGTRLLEKLIGSSIPETSSRSTRACPRDWQSSQRITAVMHKDRGGPHTDQELRESQGVAILAQLMQETGLTQQPEQT